MDKNLKKLFDMSYEDLCNYLKEKNGTPPKPYFTEGWSKNSKYNTRTKEGLVIHHIREDEEDMLSTIDKAKTCPYDWQLPENLVYCDLIEHLILHIKISQELKNERPLGFGGCFNWLIPELNDVYKGVKVNAIFKLELYMKVLNNYEVEDYVRIVKIACKTFADHKKKYNLKDIVRPQKGFIFNNKYLCTKNPNDVYVLMKLFEKHKIKESY